MEHEQGSGRERAQMMASEERELSDLFRRAEVDYEARLSSQVFAHAETAGTMYRALLRYVRCTRISVAEYKLRRRYLEG